MIFTGFKRKSNQIFFNKNWQELLEKSSLVSNGNIKNALIIVNSQIEKDAVENVLVEILKLSVDKIDCIIFQQKIKKEQRNLAIITPKDFGWNGKVPSEKLKNILTKNYDLLINYSKVENVYVNLLILHCKVAFRVGFGHLNKKLYDFIVKCDPTEISLFHTELIKYLKILKKIE
ncbi:hypothetical protein [Lutibacter sp.]|uniref:DUF6913 domain-containing protein n=1 Tax=Lutibacter sp. TaxID=1925666 RepID=UPI001A20465A|nr:hypothetical protein [Lutibacter sp.]MBI9042054.1 hypothetical protein [Lutibacter sp.]